LVYADLIFPCSSCKVIAFIDPTRRRPIELRMTPRAYGANVPSSTTVQNRALPKVHGSSTDAPGRLMRASKRQSKIA
jgi:hypothetical protein